MPAIIEASAVSKCFRQPRRFPGVVGALRTLLTREFTEVVAVEGVSFEIERGEAVGYLGPNGAGKSTMIKMLTGILLPTSGSVRVLGRTPHVERLKNAREIGVVFGQRSQLWWDLPVVDSFELHRRIYKIPSERYRENLARFSELLALGPFLERAVRQLSLGERMRAEVVMALLHDPKILFLDEPTIGLDVVAKDAVRRFLREVNKGHRARGAGHRRADPQRVHERSPCDGRRRRLVIYAAVARIAFQTQLAYRGQVWAHIFGQFIQVYFKIAIWQSVYRGQARVDGVSLPEMITYAVLAGTVLSAWSGRA